MITLSNRIRIIYSFFLINDKDKKNILVIFLYNKYMREYLYRKGEYNYGRWWNNK